MNSFTATMARLAQLPDRALIGPWAWPGHSGEPLQGREALYISLLEEQARQLSVPGTESAQAAARAGAALGSLSGLLAGRSDDLLDRQPDAGEWALRQVLGHVLLTERRYLAQTRYAASRRDQEPASIETVSELPEEETAGGVDELLQRLSAMRAEAGDLARLPAGVLERPSIWAGHPVDVRFRLGRFAVHIQEHTIQCEKLLDRLGETSLEARRIVRLVWAARGFHEPWTDGAGLAELDAAHAQRALALAG